VLVSATVRSLTPDALDANWTVSNTVIRTLLGGTLPPGVSAANNSTINLIDPDHQLFASNRRTQVDMRFAKILRFAGRRADVGVDLYNLFNSNVTTAYQQTYEQVTNGAAWLRPTAIASPRLARLHATLDF